MNRALRLLALLSLVAAVVFFVVEKTRPPLDDPNLRDQLPYYFLREPLFGQTSLLLAVAVGVVTVMVAVWRGQRAWVSIVLVALLVAANGAIVFIFSLSAAALFAFFTAVPFLSFAMLISLRHAASGCRARASSTPCLGLHVVATTCTSIRAHPGRIRLTHLYAE